MAAIRRRPDILDRLVDDEFILYDVMERKVHILNASARFVWELCDGTCSMEMMVERALTSYEASVEEIRTDIEACVGDFQALSLLE